MAEERASLEELGLRIKEEELKLKQAEIKAKERDLGASKWSNPLVLAILGATIGLLTNVIVTYANNRTTEETERVRSQSSLVLEAIKGNSKDATCENLVFFVNLGLLDDEKSTIRTACPSTKGGVPSLPAGGPATGNPFSTNDGRPNNIFGLWIIVADADSQFPIYQAAVEVRSQLLGSLASGVTDERGYVTFPLLSALGDPQIVVTRPGYETLTTPVGSAAGACASVCLLTSVEGITARQALKHKVHPRLAHCGSPELFPSRFPRPARYFKVACHGHRSHGCKARALSPQPTRWPHFPARVQIELTPQVLLCADVVVVIRIRREELVLALGTRGHSRDFVLVLQDDEAPFHAADYTPETSHLSVRFRMLRQCS